MAGHVVNRSTKLWDLTSPVGYHWQCVCRHGACAVSRDLCGGGKFSPHIRNPRPRFAYSLYNFYGATMTFKGRLLLASLVLKLFWAENFWVEIGPQNKRHILAQIRVFWRILRQCPWWRLSCRWWTEPKKLECGPMPNVMAALPNTGDALCWTPQSWLTPTIWVPCSNAANIEERKTLTKSELYTW